MKVLALAAFFTASVLAAPALNCVASGIPTSVRSEGLSERLGDIVLNCSGGAPGSVISGNLAIFLPAPVTNKLSQSNTLDAILTIDTGSGPQSSGVAAMLQGTAGVAFNGFSVTLPASGAVAFRVSNVRMNANAVAQSGPMPVTALIGMSAGSVALANTQVSVAVPTRGLLSMQPSTRIDCSGSPLPDTITFGDLLGKGTSFATTRVTEGFAGAFERRQPFTDTGTRVILRYAGLPKEARLFVPDYIAGSTALQPTSAGGLGLSSSGGVYAAGGRGSLLLARVAGTDANGSGGNIVYPAAPLNSGQSSFNNVSELSISGGSAFTVYEVVDADPNTQETAQIPTFIGIPRLTDTSNIPVATVSLSLAPVSTDSTASSSPVPRFALVEPASDCSAVGDCGARYFPKLLVDPVAPIQITAASNASYQVKYIRVVNTSGGLMFWNASITYRNGSGWVRLDPPSGGNNSTLRIDIVATGLAPGTYAATVTVDAGAAVGTANIPIQLTVTASPPAPPQPPAPPAPPAGQTPPAPAVASVVNAASFSVSGVVPGSIATLKGSNLNGKNVSVMFDTFPAKLLYQSDSQINLLVPEELAGRPNARLTINVDGVAGAPVTLPLAATAPSIFANGILNQDNSVNGVLIPAQAGSIVQIFLTGMAVPEGAKVIAHLHDFDVDSLAYAGPAPGLPGVQQVNLQIPPDMPAMTTEVLICASSVTGRICSAPAKITLRQ